MNTLRPLRQFLSGNPPVQGSPCRNLTAAFERQKIILQVFYVFVLFVSVLNLNIWDSHISGPALIPLWPLFWTSDLNPGTASAIVLVLQLGTALLGAFFGSSRLVRSLVFLGLLEYVALRGSYGKVGHSFHLLVLISFLLIFLPRGWHSSKTVAREIRARTLLIFTACQFMVMFSYSIAGAGKVVVAIYQICIGQIHAFHPQALALHISQRLLETGDRSFLGPWLIDHGIYAWPMMQATLYLQLFAVFIVFRPSLHKLWAAGLIFFHLFSYFILTINFPFNCFLLGLFFLVENRPPSSFRQMLADLPIIGMLLRRAFPKLP